MVDRGRARSECPPRARHFGKPMKFPPTWRGVGSSRRPVGTRSAALGFWVLNLAVLRPRRIFFVELGTLGILLRFYRRSPHRTRPMALPLILRLPIFSRLALRIWIALLQTICTRPMSRRRLALSPAIKRDFSQLPRTHIHLMGRSQLFVLMRTSYFPSQSELYF